MKKYMNHIFILIYICSGILFGYLGGDQTAALAELNENIVELPTGSPLDFGDDVFRELDVYLERSQVIGLGEATHGTKEFSELKQRLFKYLVRNHRCRALGFEYGFRFQKSLEIENYVISGKGDLDSIISNLHWIHRNQEFQGLVKWIREYNNFCKKEDMVHFIGIDSQIDIWFPDELKQHFAEFETELNESVSGILEGLIERGRINHGKLDKEEYQKIRDELALLLEKTTSFFSKNPRIDEKYKRALLLHNVESHIYSHECRFWMYKKKYLRDSHMAKHVLWLKDLMGKEAKVAVWGHNAHVANDPEYSRDGSPSMGYDLKERLGEDYLVVGTGFTDGKFVAVTEDYFGKDTEPIVWNLEGNPPENSVNFIFQGANFENFLLNIKRLSKTGNLYGYLNERRPFFGVGDFYCAPKPDIHYSEDRIINLATAYDVLFYFSGTNPVTIFPEVDKESR
jgi:erythromycin esterase